MGNLFSGLVSKKKPNIRSYKNVNLTSLQSVQNKYNFNNNNVMNWLNEYNVPLYNNKKI